MANAAGVVATDAQMVAAFVAALAGVALRHLGELGAQDPVNITNAFSTASQLSAMHSAALAMAAEQRRGEFSALGLAIFDGRLLLQYNGMRRSSRQ